ncbi:MAG: hypothetical protein WC095_02125 [Candidatus Paceibacterota bacterium]
MKYFFSSIIFYSVPFFTFAFGNEGGTFKSVVAYVISILNLMVPIMFGAALVVFFWGLSKFVINSGNEAELSKGKNYMLWGILALFILFSYRTIVTLVVNDLEFGKGGDGSAMPFLPTGGQIEWVDSTIKF